MYPALVSFANLKVELRFILTRGFRYASPWVSFGFWSRFNHGDGRRVFLSLELAGVRTRNGNLSTVRSALLVDWSANALRRNAQPPSQSSWSSRTRFAVKRAVIEASLV